MNLIQTISSESGQLSLSPGQQSTVAGFATDDYDRDGFQDFTVSEGLRGRVYVVENCADNEYQVAWQDSTPFVNLYFHTSGDVDGDGWPEFFLAATMSNGTWVLVYEAVGNNRFSPRFLFHLLAAGVLDYPTLFTSDMNDDGRNELIVFSGSYLHFFRGYRDDAYALSYLKQELVTRGAKHSVQVYDIDNDGIKDLLISKAQTDSTGQHYRFFADAYRGTSLTRVHRIEDYTLSPTLRAYPNPFNAECSIEYWVPTQQRVRISIHDVAGRRLRVLLDGIKSRGNYTLRWEASNLPSGVYFCRLEFLDARLTQKLVLSK
ncbi:MAG: T9SS type A sorting domain-containing protein [Ignavibacteriae bacterium]|nr:T9SS type A sorting domain-containing protein [Ignavibacteriota bacterium]